MLGGLAGLVGLSVVAGVLITATVTPAIAVSGAAASSAITLFDKLPSELEIDTLMLPTTIFAKNPAGEYVELTRFYDQNRSQVDYDEVNPVMYDAVLSSEDPRYYEHGGIDLIGTTRALLSNAAGGAETQGGSSISQQYVKNVLVQKCEADAPDDAARQDCFFEATQAEGVEGYQRKLQEMRYAIALEKEYSKNDILLGYLNIANLGGTTYGVDAASRYYFGVAAKDMSVGQAAIIAGIVQNPNTYRIDKPGGSTTDKDGNPLNSQPDGVLPSPGGSLVALDRMLEKGTITQEQYAAAVDGYSLTKGRQLYVLGRMLEDGKITQAQFDEAAIAPITPAITRPNIGCAAAIASGTAYFCQYVRGIIENDEAFGATPEERSETLRRGGLNVYTTLDMDLQAVTQQAMSEWTPTAVENMQFGAAAVSLETSTGRVLSLSQNTLFDETDAGSTIPGNSAQVYAVDKKYGSAIGFSTGSTFKLFTLIDWLEKGHSLNEVLNGRNRVFPRMTNTCPVGDWVNVEKTKITNFGNVGGSVGTVKSFTDQSLNSGYLAMAEKLDLCDIQKVAARMGVTTGDGNPLEMSAAFDVLGSKAISPLTMAAAYATVANGGIYCTPRAIDSITDVNGEPRELPKSSCEQVLAPEIAATAAYALQSVMQNGTGRPSNPRDGTPLIGKTGTHNGALQTMMIESSTKVTTAVWVGNEEGTVELSREWFRGVKMSDLRHEIAPAIQHAANLKYGGDRFPDPKAELIKTVLTDLPNVVGQTVEQATANLRDAGFDVIVGDPVDSTEAAGIVARQDPAGGKVAGGIAVTINPSNGQGKAIPDVTGERPDEAVGKIRAAGFGSVSLGTCTEDAGVGGPGRATGTTPGAGSMVNVNTAITVNYSKSSCP